MRAARPLPHRIILICALTGIRVRSTTRASGTPIPATNGRPIPGSTILDGKALQANLSGIPYGRFFTR